MQVAVTPMTDNKPANMPPLDELQSAKSLLACLYPSIRSRFSNEPCVSLLVYIGGLEIRKEIDLLRYSRQKLNPLFMILDISNACPKDKPVNRSIM